MMKKKKKKPRFYCDNCATEVAASADRCPRCGKYFSSIRCPKCFWTGDTAAFANGCPNCGYSSSKTKSPGTERGASGGAGRRSKSSSGKSLFSGSIIDSVPNWFYIAAILFFVLLFALLLLGHL